MFYVSFYQWVLRGPFTTEHKKQGEKEGMYSMWTTRGFFFLMNTSLEVVLT